MVIRDKESHYTVIKGLIHQEDITTVNIYRHNKEAHKHKEMLADQKEETQHYSNNGILQCPTFSNR